MKLLKYTAKETEISSYLWGAYGQAKVGREQMKEQKINHMQRHRKPRDFVTRSTMLHKQKFPGHEYSMRKMVKGSSLGE